MNATFRFAVKSCLLAAVSGVLLNQVVGFAQDGTSGDSPSGPTIRRTATYQDPGSTAPSSPGTQPTSEVQKQLQELYRKNGREMPSMNMDDLPNTQPTAMPPSSSAQNSSSTAKKSAPTSTNRTAAKPQKPNFFERLFRIGRARKQPPTAAQPARSPSPTAQPPRYLPLQQQFAAPPGQPLYSSPQVSVTPGSVAAPQPPREPSVPQGSSNPLARTSPNPGIVSRPVPRNGISPPLNDDDDSKTDSESMELDEDDQAAETRAPQILPNQTANGPVNSPYSGLRIAPLDEEQKFANSRSAGTGSVAAPDRPAALGSDSRDAWKASRTEPAPLEPANDAAAVPDAKADDDDLDLKVESDDGDDADHPTLPSGAARSTEKSADSATGKPAQEKPSEKSAKETDDELPIATPMKGFRGYCPVALKDERKLVEALPDFESEYHGKLYTFSSAEAKTIFELNPRKYVPAGEGADVVRRMAGEKEVAGTLEHAAWYRGRLYLFSSAQTRSTFVETPSKFVAVD
jgi:YHS domain-containing protein